MNFIRRWATFRGERCLTTLWGSVDDCRRGQLLVAGSGSFVVTRILGVKTSGRELERAWEVWGRDLQSSPLRRIVRLVRH
jgi:hypothetical protein